MQYYQSDKKEMIDWNMEWRNYIATQNSFHSDSAYWDGRAPKYRKKNHTDDYEDLFYELIKVRPGDTIFDMGCGAGALAISFAEKGHETYAADFSVGMLDAMMEDACSMKLEAHLHPIQLDWNENWSIRDLPICDVAICTRALIFDNLDESLRKLESRAKRRVCLGILDEMYSMEFGQSEIILNYLKQRGIQPEFKKIRFRSGNGDRLDAMENFIAWDLCENR